MHALAVITFLLLLSVAVVGPELTVLFVVLLLGFLIKLGLICLLIFGAWVLWAVSGKWLKAQREADDFTGDQGVGGDA
jgi:fatty acid desaturase